MFLVVGRIDGLLGDDVILRSQHVELRVVENLLGIGQLSHALLGALGLVRPLFEHESLLAELALKLGRLVVEVVIEGHLLAQVAVLPKREGASAGNSDSLKCADTLVQVKLALDVCERDLPGLQAEGRGEQQLHLAVVALERLVLAQVFVFLRIISRVIVAQVVHVLHQVGHGSLFLFAIN